jgi:hypothetical protein
VGLRQLQVNREGQITERFTRAIDQLGSEALDVRLGGSMLWSESLGPQKPTTARSWKCSPLICESTPLGRLPGLVSTGQTRNWPALSSCAFEPLICKPSRPYWVDASLGMRPMQGIWTCQPLTLGRQIWLRPTWRGPTSGEPTWRGPTSGSPFGGGPPPLRPLEAAVLWAAHFEAAILLGAHLEWAELEGAHLEGADLRVTDGLTQFQIASALTDSETKLPAYLAEPSADTPDEGADAEA